MAKRKQPQKPNRQKSTGIVRQRVKQSKRAKSKKPNPRKPTEGFSTVLAQAQAISHDVLQGLSPTLQEAAVYTDLAEAAAALDIGNTGSPPYALAWLIKLRPKYQATDAAPFMESLGGDPTTLVASSIRMAVHKGYRFTAKSFQRNTERALAILKNHRIEDAPFSRSCLDGKVVLPLAWMSLIDSLHEMQHQIDNHQRERARRPRNRSDSHLFCGPSWWYVACAVMLVHKGMEEVRSVLAQAKRLPDSGLRMEERWFFRAREVLRQLEQVLAVIDRGRPEAARIVADRLLHGEWRFESEVSQITEKMKAMRQAVFELLPLGHPLRVGSDDEVSEAPRSTMTGTGEEYTWERRAWYVGAVNARRKNGIRMANSQFDRPAKRNNIPSRPAPGFKYQKEYAYEAVIQCKDFAVYANTWKKQREEDLKLLDEDSEQ